jgi:hypothetical protein
MTPFSSHHSTTAPHANVGGKRRRASIRFKRTAMGSDVAPVCPVHVLVVGGSRVLAVD